jgi:hypothetical protein
MTNTRQGSWLPAIYTDRRALMTGGFAWLLSSRSADAQSAPLTADKLKRLIARALAEKDTTPFSRPHIVGFTENSLTTRSLEFINKDTSDRHGFMVAIPQHPDGLIFFEGRKDPLFFAVHRTGEHLNRVASAINRKGALSNWSGPEAEADFAKQKAYWATQI